MASSIIGALRVTLGLDSANFETGAKKTEARANRLGSSLKMSLGGVSSLIKSSLAGLAAGFGVGALIALTKGGLEYAASLAEVAQQLGVTSKELQVYRYAASQVGVTNEEIDKGLAKLTLNMGKANVAGSEQAKMFARWGISMTDASGRAKSAGEVILEVADHVKSLKSPADQGKVAFDALGKAGQRMVPLLAQGREGILGLVATAERLGLIISPELIAHADEAADKMSTLMQVLRINIASTVAHNASAILTLANALLEAAGAVGTFIQKWSAVSDLGGLYKGGTATKDAVTSLMSTSTGRTVFLGEINRKIEETQKALATGKARHKVSEGALGTLYKEEPATLAEMDKMRADLQHYVNAKGSIQSRIAKGDTYFPPLKVKPGALPDTTTQAEKDAAAAKAAADAKRAAAEALRAEKDYQNRVGDLRAQILGSEADIAGTEDERVAAARAQLEAQRQSDLTDIQLDERLTDARKDELAGLTNELYNDRQKAITREHDIQAARNALDLQTAGIDNQKDILQAQEALATSASKRREIELQLLDLEYKEQEAKLDAVTIANGYNETEVAIATERKRYLGQLKSLQAENIRRETAGPLEQFQNELNAKDINEQLQTIKVDGLKSLEDGLLDVVHGTKSVSEAFKDMADVVLTALQRIVIEELIIKPLTAVLRGEPIGKAFGDIHLFGGKKKSIPIDPAEVAADGLPIGSAGATAANLPERLDTSFTEFNSSFSNTLSQGAALFSEAISGAISGSGGGGLGALGGSLGGGIGGGIGITPDELVADGLPLKAGTDVTDLPDRMGDQFIKFGGDLENILGNGANGFASAISSVLALLGGGGGGGGGIGGILGGIIGIAGSLFGGGGGGFSTPALAWSHTTLPGFATGGGFSVGGSGAIDSKLVQFRATPGEMVDIRKPGNDNRPEGRVQVEVVPSDYFDVRVREVAAPLADRAKTEGAALGVRTADHRRRTTMGSRRQ